MKQSRQRSNDASVAQNPVQYPWPALGALIVIGLAFALRLYRLGSVELWFDETASYAVASKGYLDILAYVRQASGEHPPLYYFALHAWMTFAGSSELALRYFSLIPGVLLIAVVYRFVRREFGDALGLGASVAAAASPFMVVYSQEARMYTLVPLIGILSMQLFLRAVRRGHVRDWASLAAVILVGESIHYYFVIIMAGQALFLLAQHGRANRRPLVQWLVMAAIPVVLVAIWLLISPGPLQYFPNVLAPRFAPWNNSIERLVQDMVWGEPFGYDFPLAVRVLVIAAWLPLLFGLWAARPRPGFAGPSPAASPGPERSPSRQAYVLCVATLAGGFLSVLIAPQGVVGRHFAIMVPPFLILLTLGLAELNRRSQTAGSLAVVGVLLLFVVGIQNQLSVNKGDWGAALAALAQASEPGDVIVLPHPTVWPIVEYYHRQSDVPVYYYVPQVLDPNSGPLSDAELAHLETFMTDIAAGHPRIWLGLSDIQSSDPQQVIPRWLAEHDFAMRADFHNTASFYLFAGGALDTPPVDVQASFGDSIRLVNAQLNSLAIAQGQPLLFDLSWQTRTRLASDDVVIVQLVDERGASWAEQRILPCGGFCLTSDWPVDSPVEDRHGLLIPPGTPPGTYQLRLELYDPRVRASLPLDGNAASLRLARIEVLPNPDAPTPVTNHPLAVRFGPALRLMGFAQAGAPVREGDAWSVDLVWGADGTIADNLTAVFRWTDSKGVLLGETPAPIGTGTYQTSAWLPGIAMRQHYAIPLPANPPNDLHAQLLVRSRAAGFLPITQSSNPAQPLGKAYPAPGDPPDWIAQKPAAFDFGSVQVAPIERRFNRPDVQYPIAVQLSDQFAVIGYAQPLPGRKTVDVTIYWQALARPRANYKVFVHIIDAGDHVLAQDDSEPASGFRPTSGWLPGEYVVDEHRISLGSLPSDTYRVEIGMYDPQTGVRLPVLMNQLPQPGDRAVIGTITLP